MLPAQYKETI